PSCRTGTATSAPWTLTLPPATTGTMTPACPLDPAEVASRTRAEPTFSHTSTRAAPVPSATIRAICGRISSVATARAIPPENSETDGCGDQEEGEDRHVLQDDDRERVLTEP